MPSKPATRRTKLAAAKFLYLSGCFVLVAAGCATPQSVKQAQDQAEQATAASRNLQVQLKAMQDAEAAREQALAAELAGIEAAQNSTSQQLQGVADKLDRLHGELLQAQAAAHAGKPSAGAAAATGPARPSAARSAAQTPATTSPPASSSAADAAFASLEERVKQIALGNGSAPAPAQAPRALAQLSYGAYQAIRYVGHTPSWEGSDYYRLNFYPAGFVFQQGTLIHLIGDDSSSALRFSPNDFRWPAGVRRDLPPRVPVAGFDAAESYSAGEASSFLDFRGASYFQAATPGSPFGLSARGIAINTGVDNTAEEFPRFAEFWLGASGGTQLNVVALLSGDSVVGAFRFDVKPLPKRTLMYVTQTLYLLRSVAQLGLAPLTSMYLQGSDSQNRPDARANAVHDSDGLLIHDGDAWSWIPLDNPPRLTIIDIPVKSLTGFGLIQRDREYSDYQVPDSRYQDHPNAWVEPSGDWGDGTIKLIELPAQHPSNDNIVAFFNPANPPAPKQPLHLAYRLTWSANGPPEGKLGRVLATRIASLKGGHYAVMIDFGGGDLTNLPDWVDIKPRVTTSDKAVTVSDVTLGKVAETGHWRLSFNVGSGGSNEQVSAWLSYGQRDLTERWTRNPPAS